MYRYQLIIKGNLTDALLALRAHSIIARKVKANTRDLCNTDSRRGQVEAWVEAGADLTYRLNGWMVQHANVLTGFGYPEGTLLHWSVD